MCFRHFYHISKLSFPLFLHTGKNAKFATSFSYGAGVFFFGSLLFTLNSYLASVIPYVFLKKDKKKTMSQKEKKQNMATLFHELKTIY